jgi:hypothetical protein
MILQPRALADFLLRIPKSPYYNKGAGEAQSIH